MVLPLSAIAPGSFYADSRDVLKAAQLIAFIGEHSGEWNGADRMLFYLDQMIDRDSPQMTEFVRVVRGFWVAQEKAMIEHEERV